jgi:5-methylcytosine-specific restriction protein A
MIRAQTFDIVGCSFPRCARRASRGGLCVEHGRDAARTREQLEPWREWYRTEAWARLRAYALRRSPFCQCGESECRRRATVVDHRVPHRGDKRTFWNVANLQTLSKRCHDRKTGREVQARRVR